MRPIAFRARVLAASGAFLLTCLTGVSFADDPSPSPSPTTAPLPVRVLIDEITPKAPTRTDTLHLSGRLIAGSSALDDLNLRVLIGPTLARFDLHMLEQTPRSPAGLAGTVVNAHQSHLDAGASERFTL